MLEACAVAKSKLDKFGMVRRDRKSFGERKKAFLKRLTGVFDSLVLS
jgi:hypothetical protein